MTAKRSGLCAILFFGFSLFPIFPAAGQPSDAVPVLYRATKVNQAGTTLTVLLPRPFEAFDPARYADSLLKAFDACKAEHPFEYGRAVINLDVDVGRTRRVTLTLDPERRESWDLVISEVFHTLRALGISEVFAPAVREGPLDPTQVRLPVFLEVVPFFEALPPRTFAYAFVLLPNGDIVSSRVFTERIRAGDRIVLDPILAGLEHPSEALRLSVLSAIPNLPVQNRAQRLLPLLGDKSSAVRLAVLKLLESDNSREVLDRVSQLVETDPDATVKLTAVRFVSARGIKKFEYLVELEKLSDPSDDVVIAAIGRLVAAKNPMVAPAIRDVLRHKSPAVRQAARDGLVKLGAFDQMVETLTDDRVDLATRESFGRHLAESGSGTAQVRGLAYLLATGSEESAIKAAQILGANRPGEGLGLLYNALLRPEPAVRVASARAIGAFRNPESLRPMLNAMKAESDRSVAEEVAVTIVAAQPLDTILTLMEGQDVTIRRLAMKALGDSLKGAAPPPRAISVLQSRLSDPDLGVKRAAVYTLARVPDDRVTASIMGLASDPDAEIREAAIVAATRSKDPRSNDVLLKALSDESDRVKLAALDAVGQRKIQAAREPLQMMGHYQDVEVRRRAVAAFIALLGPSEAANEFDFLSGLLYDPDPKVKLAALAAVRTVHERRAIVAISGLVIDPASEVKLAAIDALAASGERDALEGVEKAVFDSDKAVRLAALDGLQRLGRKEALDFLSELLRLEKDPDIIAKAEAVQKALLDR